MWNSIKEILQNEKGKCIIIEDGKPVFVLLSVEEYLALKERKQDVAAVSSEIRAASSLIQDNDFEKLLASQPQELEAIPAKVEIENEKKIRLEDLPF